MKDTKNIEEMLNQVINGDCVEVMSNLPENSIDLVVTSPPYSVNISYDVYDDNTTIDEYLNFTKKWLQGAFRLLKDDGRICVNVPFEINLKDRGGRIFIVSEIWNIMKEVGYKWFGLIDLEEDSPHRSKTTAWGSWMSCSQPYIYNPKECLILAYKHSPKKLTKGEPQWKGTPTEIEQEDGTIKKKTVYEDTDKKEFMELVFGQWNYFADTRSLTKATFSSDIPTKAIKILSYKNDIVLDPFAGSGTSLVSAEILGRRWIGVELSENYCKIAEERVQGFVDLNKQKELEFEKDPSE
jgi:site-specific DNA-methyltransferase (adenine-specific)